MKPFKSLLAITAVITALTFTPQTQAYEDFAQDLMLQNLNPTDIINWKVGDTMDYSLNLGFFGKGSSNKTVTKDEGKAIWLQQTMKIFNKNEVIDALINKADGKVLKLIRNGQEQQIPDDKIEIISQDYTEITVPAGTFPVLHVVAKTKQVSKLEIWANPPKTVIDGVVKQIMTTQLGNITFELTSFKQGQ